MPPKYLNMTISQENEMGGDAKVFQEDATIDTHK